MVDARGYAAWQVEETADEVNPQEVAIVVCDVWDNHWCPTVSSCDLLPREPA